MLDKRPLPANKLSLQCMCCEPSVAGMFITQALSYPTDGLYRCSKSAPSWHTKCNTSGQRMLGNPAQKHSLPRGLTHTAPTLSSPPHPTPQPPHSHRAAGHSSPVVRVSPCKEDERRLETSSSVLFSSKCFFIHFSSLNKVGKRVRCCERLGASLCSAQPPHCIPPVSTAEPPVPSHAFSFLIPLKFREIILKIEFNFCARKWIPSQPCVEGGLAWKLLHLEVYNLNWRLEGFCPVLTFLCTCILGKCWVGHESHAPGGKGQRWNGHVPLDNRSNCVAPLHRDLRQHPETPRGSCQLSPLYGSTNYSNPLNYLRAYQRAVCEPSAAPEAQTGTRISF